MTRVPYPLFILSGAAGLIYESISTRCLGLFVGHDAYAQIIGLVSFLGGMSAGARAVSRTFGAAAGVPARVRAGRACGRGHRVGIPRRVPVEHRFRLPVHFPGGCRLPPFS
jgi:hypothetical protein